MRWLADNVLDLALAQSGKALASGALVPLAMDLRVIEDGGVSFQVRTAGALAKKDLTRALKSGSQSAVPYDPFEPFDPEMFVADVETNDARGGSSTHVALLNKFPAIPGHIVLVTRRFASQLAPLTREDFGALAQLSHAMNGLLFYNGGPLAGASQEHRHFQIIPAAGPWPIEALITHGLPFRHAVIRHDLANATSPERATDMLERAFQDACGELGIDLTRPMMPPLNFLATREWLMVVPRTREHWIAEDSCKISVNALGFAGLLLVRSEELAAALQRYGILRMLDSVTR